MDLENKIEAQRKRMEQEKNKLDMLMKKVTSLISVYSLKSKKVLTA